MKTADFIFKTADFILDWITAVKYLPDQNCLAYSSRDGTLQLFSLTRCDLGTIFHLCCLNLPQFYRGLGLIWICFARTRLEEEVPTLEPKQMGFDGTPTNMFGSPSRDGVGMRAFEWSPTYRCDFTPQTMGFTLKTMEFTPKTMDFTLKTMEFVLGGLRRVARAGQWCFGSDLY